MSTVIPLSAGATVRRVVLEATVARRVVRRRHDDAVGTRKALAAAVVFKDGEGHRRCRRELPAWRQHHVHAVGDQHLQRAGRGRLGQRMRVGTQEQRSIDAQALAAIADGLGDGQHMPLVERGVQRRAAVARRSEDDPLLLAGQVRPARPIGRLQRRQVDEGIGRRRPAGQRMDLIAHGLPAPGLECRSGAAPPRWPPSRLTTAGLSRQAVSQLSYT